MNGHAVMDEIIAKSLSTRICAFFDAHQRQALEAQLRSDHKTGQLILDYQSGVVCGVRWEEIRR